VLFFGKSPNHLSVAQITALSIIPNRPTSLRLGKHNDKITKERNKWLNILGKAEVFDKQVISDALAEPLNAHRRAAPKFAPHLSYRLKSEYPNNPIISTNLQYNKQQQVATIVSNYIRRIYHQHIRNAAVMVVNNKTMAVEAYIGSADFYNSEDAGQVDGVRAVRSPGSTLKPFLYGMAFDKGLITQKMKVSDVPINFGGYVPVNYDGTYNGSVTVEKALASSLNIPPVKILDNMGVALFVDGLVNAGFRQIKKDRRKLGLSVVLGGCGVRLEELVNLYSSFANKGQYKSLQFIQQDSSQTTQNKPFQARLLSESSAFIITDILSQLTRPDLPQHIESSKNLPIVSWKTGTSYGRRDAWSIGYNGNYTIGVWVGNFSGESVPELTGADIATPLLFALFNSLDYAPVKDWFISPKALDFRWVCSGSGLLPNEFCEDQIMDYYLPMVSPMTICSHLQKVWLSADEKYSYCTSCLPVNNYKTKQFPYFAPEITAYYEKAHIPYEKIPTHNPKCERIFDGKAPEIVSPTNGLEYLIDPLDNNQIMLKCNVTNDVQKVYWYINKDFYQQSSTSASLFFVPKTGKNTITCVDDKGRKHSITITVRSL